MIRRNRLKFLTNPEFTQLGTEVEKHIESWINTSNPAETAGLLDEVCLEILSKVYQAIRGSEGTVWLAGPNSDALIAVINSGPNADDVIGFEQPVGSGIISMVFAQQQPYCENEISSKSSGHDDTLDRQTLKSTRAMVAVPFYFAYGLRGVISCVQLHEPGAPEPTGFKSCDVEMMVLAANSVERLVNGRLLSLALGFDEG